MAIGQGYQAGAAGLAAGMALPTRFSGMSDVIKSITNDLRAAAASRDEERIRQEEAATKSQTSQTENIMKLRQQNVDVAKSLLTSKYKIKPGANFEEFLSTGDLSIFEAPPSEAEQISQIQQMTGVGGGGFPQGTTYKLGNFNIPLNPAQTPERANTISALETMDTLLTDMDTLLTEAPGRVVSGNVLGLNLFDRKSNAIFRQYDKTAAIASGGKQLTQTELALIASNRPTVADVGDPAAMQYKMENLRKVLRSAHNRLTRGLPGETQLGTPGAADMLQGGDQGQWVRMVKPDGSLTEVHASSVQEALDSGYQMEE